MMRRLVWGAGIAGFFLFGLAAGDMVPGQLLALVLLAAWLLCGAALGLFPIMTPRRYSPDTRLARAKLYGAFAVAALAGAILGVLVRPGLVVSIPLGMIALALLAFVFKWGAIPRSASEE
jgi:hypothetical protein